MFWNKKKQGLSTYRSMSGFTPFISFTQEGWAGMTARTYPHLKKMKMVYNCFA